MNVMGQLLDKAKRVIVMRTTTTEKCHGNPAQPSSYPLAQSNPPKPILPIRILDLDAKIENRPTIIDEKSTAVLKYRTPHFRYDCTRVVCTSFFLRL